MVSGNYDQVLFNYSPLKITQIPTQLFLGKSQSKTSLGNMVNKKLD